MAANRENQELQQRLFAEKCRRLHSHLLGTKNLLEEIREYNRTKWPVHYPLAKIAKAIEAGNHMQQGLRRASSVTYMDSAASHSSPASLRRSQTLNSRSSFDDASTIYSENESGDSEGIGRLLDPNDLSVLRLDLRLSYHADSDIMGSLEESSISRLFDERLSQCEVHIDKLIARITDKSSKILVTGDLNAGKSTLVNALLRREILPFDQQPCTMLFCEVVDASENDGVEEIHAVPDMTTYNRANPSTYVTINKNELEDVVMDNVEQYQQLKIYSRDKRSTDSSLLHNGTIDVSLIDSPGLNRDSLKTTQLFARQEEIDVVVFVVNAENHFTLSGQDFLINAGNEKAHIFIVVNRFDAIRRKDRCERMILDQIRDLSPLTYEERQDLVHFVSARDLLVSTPGKEPEPFARMEKCLRSFTLEQRFKSKLAPAQRYAMNVLCDIQYLAAENVASATKKIQEINKILRENMPKYETLLNERTRSNKAAEDILDSTCLEVRRHTTAHLTNATVHLEDISEKVDWPGIFSLWSYAENVLLTMVHHLEHEVSECDRFTSFTIKQAHNALSKLEDQRKRLNILEGSVSESSSSDAWPVGAENNNNSDTFTAGMDTSISASQLAPIGSISNALDTAQLELSDFFDLDFSHNWGALTSISASASMALFATKSMASNMLTILRLSSTMGQTTARRLIVTAAVVIGVGSMFYIVSDIDESVRRRLSTRIRGMLEEEGFVENHAQRLTTETSRAIRPFVWHLQHTFERMVEAEERRRADQMRKRHVAQDSQIYFDELRAKAHEIANAVRAVSADANM